MSAHGSITVLIDQLKMGDPEAVRKLWEIYFPRLVPLANRFIERQFRRVADGEDIAVSVFRSLCARAVRGDFSQLHDRADLWSLLTAITMHKAIDQKRRECRQRRGGGNLVTESDLQGSGASIEVLDQIFDKGPAPDTVALMADQLRHLLDRLDDDTLRSIAILRMHGHTVAEIAAKLGRVHRAIERKLDRIRETWRCELE